MQLQRLPKKHDKSLRAWDAADRQLADFAQALIADSDLHEPSVWVLNDQFGAISCFLGDDSHSWFNDSATSHDALSMNRAANRLTPLADVAAVSYDILMASAAKTAPAVVILRIPKTLSFLRQQLAYLNQILPNNTPIILGGMQKYVDRSVIELIKVAATVVEVPRAEKKARLVVAQSNTCQASEEECFEFDCEALGQTIQGDANVFCHSQLDIGARAMIDVLAQAPAYNKVLDLACGNGVLGLAYYRLHRPSELVLSDDSSQAVQSALSNMLRAGAENSRCVWQNGVSAELLERELVLLNPPFHQGHVVGDHIAKQLFSQAAQVLTAAGELWVVGNRHLGYHVALKTLFNQVQCISETPKFVVLRCKDKK